MEKHPAVRGLPPCAWNNACCPSAPLSLPLQAGKMRGNNSTNSISLQGCCSAAKLCPTLCDPMDCSMPGSPVLHYLPEFAQIHVHWVGDAFYPSHPLPLSSLPVLSNDISSSNLLPFLHSYNLLICLIWLRGLKMGKLVQYFSAIIST